MFNLISIIKFEQNEPIKANLILIMQANFIVCFNVILFILMALTYIGTVKLPIKVSPEYKPLYVRPSKYTKLVRI